MNSRIQTTHTPLSFIPVACVSLLGSFVTPQPVYSQGEEPEFESSERKAIAAAKFYRSPEERREAGLGTPLTNWLTFYGLLEAEYEYTKTTNRDRTTFSEDFDTEAMQIGLEAEFTDWLLGEFVLEVENDHTLRTFVDEGLIAMEFDTWAIKGGIQNLDFGEYYSHFVTGPLLEFGETRKWSLALERELSDSTDVVVYTFENEGSFNRRHFGWGASLEWVSEDESLRFATGYLSDLRQSDDLFGDEDYTNASEVPAWNISALAGFESFEITAEAVTATNYFVNEDERIRPQAYNLEMAYFVNYDFQASARVEYSKDLIDEPEWQTGLGITWLLWDHLILSVDYLYGTFKPPIEIEEDEAYLDHQNLIAVQFGFEF